MVEVTTSTGRAGSKGSARDVVGDRNNTAARSEGVGRKRIVFGMPVLSERSRSLCLRWTIVQEPNAANTFLLPILIAVHKRLALITISRSWQLFNSDGSLGPTRCHPRQSSLFWDQGLHTIVLVGTLNSFLMLKCQTIQRICVHCMFWCSPSPVDFYQS